MKPAEPAALAGLEQALGHRFRDPDLLIQATTHAGAGHGRAGAIDNERLEFLGDRVLGLVIAELLVERFSEATEGGLGPRLTALVRREALAEVAGEVGLGSYLVLSSADAAAGARNHPKLLADACEAVIAALYLDGGLEVARSFIAKGWARQIGALSTMPVEPKTALQEWAQGRGLPLPVYTVTHSSGKAHDPVFEVQVNVQGLEPIVAKGSSKRIAEKAAALALLQQLGVLQVGTS
ncbi:MAG: rnc [Rhodospirillales bacterium]|nr:rnc [Rhodospirillales bacterium]